MTSRLAGRQSSWLGVLLVAILLAAALLRFWRLDLLPPGLFYDEAFNGMDARKLLEENGLPLYFAGNNGREPLYIYLQALWVALLGPTPLALRLTSAFIGLATLPAVFWMARRLFQEETHLPVAPAVAALIGMAALGMLYWHVSVSRLAFRAVLLPLTSALAVGAFWRLWQPDPTGGGRVVRAGLWAGLWLGLTLYTYVAARVLPAVLALFVLLEFLIALARRPVDWTLWRRRGQGLLAMAAVALVVLLPLGYVFLQSPDLVGARTGDVSIFTVPPKEMPGTPLQRLAANSLDLVRGFYLEGDLNLRHNLPGRPIHDWLLALLFTVGAATMLARMGRPLMRLLLIWLLLMALPTLLSTGAPHYLRAVGMLPPLALLYALGGARLLGRLPAPRRTPAAVALLLLIVAVSGGWTARDYFVRWADQPELGRTFDVDLQLFAQEMAALTAETAAPPLLASRTLYLTPHVRFAAGALPRQDAGQRASISLPAGALLLLENDADPHQPLFLVQHGADGMTATWVQWEAGRDLLVDADLPLEEGEPIRWPLHGAGWPYVTRDLLGASVVATPGAPRYRLDVRFANGLHLVGYDVAPDRVDPEADAADPSRNAFRLTTYWQTTTPLDPATVDPFDLFAHLLFADGSKSEENGGLGRGYPTDIWQPGEIVDDRRLLTVPPDAPPGKAVFEVGLYDPRIADGAVRLPVLDGNGNVAGDNALFGVVAIAMAPPQADLADLRPLGVRYDHVVELAGGRTTWDGSNLTVELGWRALERMATGYTAFVHLLDPDGAMVAQFDQPPGGAENPTDRWLPGESVRAVFPLSLPPDLAPADVTLRVGLYEPVSGRQLPVTGVVCREAACAPGLETSVGQPFVLLPVDESEMGAVGP